MISSETDNGMLMAFEFAELVLSRSQNSGAAT